jgi:hypothetical protein
VELRAASNQFKLICFYDKPCNVYTNLSFSSKTFEHLTVCCSFLCNTHPVPLLEILLVCVCSNLVWNTLPSNSAVVNLLSSSCARRLSTWQYIDANQRCKPDGQHRGPTVRIGNRDRLETCDCYFGPCVLLVNIDSYCYYNLHTVSWLNANYLRCHIAIAKSRLHLWDSICF